MGEHEEKDELIMAKSSTPSVGLEALIAYYKDVFRIPENLNHYSPEDYKLAERRFLKHVLDDRSVSYREGLNNRVIVW